MQPRTCFPARLSPGPLLLLAVAGLAATGCHQGGVYKAASLPPQFIAPRVGSLQNVNFTRLARSAGNNEVLYPGDVVKVSIATGLEEDQAPSWSVRIAEDGTANVPLVGHVRVAGMGLTQAETAIRAESIRRGKFIDPNVSVLLEGHRSHRVTVVGAVETPGTYELPAANSDVLAALVAAGGLTEDAATIVEVQHPPRGGPSAQLAGYPPGQPGAAAPRTQRIDLEEATSGGDVDLQLEDGSTVMAMPRPKRFVHVIGLVKEADQFEIPDDQELRLLDAIALAGGRTLEIADKVKIIRTVPGQTEPVTIEASVRKAKSDGTSNIRLASGDVVSIEETPTTFLVTTIRDFVRFGFSSAVPGF